MATKMTTKIFLYFFNFLLFLLVICLMLIPIAGWLVLALMTPFMAIGRGNSGIFALGFMLFLWFVYPLYWTVTNFVNIGK